MSAYAKEPSAWADTSRRIEEKSKGGLSSLRKKRTVKPKISAPRQISGPIQGSLTSSTTDVSRLGSVDRSGSLDAIRAGSVDSTASGVRPRLRERPTDGSDRTADLLKRRYSTRYTNLQDFAAGDVPAVPTLPGSRAGSVPPSRDGRPTTSGGVRVDAQALKDPNLRPEQYVASLLADASQQDIEAFQAELRKVKNRTSVDLQASVFQNRTQFIKISKEAEKVKTELRSLRGLIGDLTGAMGQTAVATGSNLPGTDSIAARRHANRSSVANLEALWSTHLQALWKRVEGSQKYLPAVPGRHIVYESGRWVELDAATWKPRRRVHLIFLNDHFLVATEKKRIDATGNKEKTQGPAQLVALKCFPLQDVQIADLTPVVAKDTRSTQASTTSNAINVRVGAESFTFATGSAESSEKANLLTTFRRAAEELRKESEADSNRAIPSTAQESTSNMLKRLSLSANNVLSSQPNLLSTLTSNPSNNREIHIDVDGATQNLRWLETQLDDLDIEVALQRFAEAVNRVEVLRRVGKQGIKGYPALQSFVLQKLDDRAAKLALVLLRNLKDTHSWLNAAKQNVDWLSRLGFEDRARQSYLETRRVLIKKRMRQTIFDGDLHIYIYQLSYITFTLIRDTVQIYQSCFPLSSMSACISWAKDRVDEFNAVVERQLSSVDPESRTYRECVERVRKHAEMVKEAGVDFGKVVGVGL